MKSPGASEKAKAQRTFENLLAAAGALFRIVLIDQAAIFCDFSASRMFCGEEMP